MSFLRVSAIASLLFTLSTYSAHAASSKIIGSITSLTSQSDGSVIITGWACDMTIAKSIDVHAYAVNAAGYKGSVLVGNSKANLPSDVAASTACKTSKIPHGFQIKVEKSVVKNYLGKKVYVHGLSISGGLNYTVSRSGGYSFPTKIAEAPAPAPAPVPAPAPGPAPVIKTGTFDATCYLARYPDVKASATYAKNPKLHWEKIGQKGGRYPGCEIGSSASNSMTVGITPDRFAGSITSLKWNNKEYINIWDHGRQLQSAMQVDGYAECNNPTEAGSEADHKKPTSTSVLKNISFATEKSFTTDTMMAYWSAKRVTGACVKGKDPRVTSPLSKHSLQRTVNIGYKNDEQIAKMSMTFKSPREEVTSGFTYEFLTGYLNDEFTEFYSLSGTELAKVTKLNDISGSGFPNGSYHTGTNLPSAMANKSGSHAMGVYFPMSQLAKCKVGFHGYNLYRFNLGGSGANGNGTNKWSLAVNENLNSSCIVADGPNYSRTFDVYVVVGTIDQVKEKLIKLRTELP
ncbi:hypothetical protein ACES2L_01040 [Bdellovibrio bacteriovorus]